MPHARDPWTGPRRSSMRALGLLALLAAGGCTGSLSGGGAPAGPAGGGGGGASSPSAPGGPTGLPPIIDPGPTGAKAPVLDPGQVIMRRLNRAELDNTVRDLLGTTIRPGDELPQDESFHGFDTIGEVVTTSPLHVEVMEQVAGRLVDELLARPAGDPHRERILTCDVAQGGEACAREILTGFAERAFRRRVGGDEVDRLLALYTKAAAAGATPAEALGLALRAVLVSPYFLFRVELDPDPTSRLPHAVSDHELATRLSYFLWSSTPDDQLLRAADAGTLLKDRKSLDAQISRLLDDPRAEALAQHFGGQWLTVRKIEGATPDKALFPTFDEPLRAAMKRETELFFGAVLKENLPVEALVTADFTFLNDRLAQHYGLPAPGKGNAFERVSVAGRREGGVLTHGSVLLATSHSRRTSPTKRGKWVLEQLLCSPPPDPPPDVEGIDEAAMMEAKTFREKLQQHSTEPACAACHKLFDPLGFALENFDAVGVYRTTENGHPVDSKGELPDGTTLSGAADLAKVVARDQRFVACLTESLLAYAVGRGFVSPEAKHYAEAVAGVALARGGTLRAVIDAVVTSEAFVTRRAETE
jgi:hypothetical protein